MPFFDLPLSLSCSLVAKADFFLGVDSCMLHVADFSHVPSVVLFGPTKAKEFGFRLGPHITIQAKEKMEEIKVEQFCLALESIITNPDQSTLWLAT